MAYVVIQIYHNNNPSRPSLHSLNILLHQNFVILLHTARLYAKLASMVMQQLIQVQFLMVC
jgi:hypothetical protein